MVWNDIERASANIFQVPPVTRRAYRRAHRIGTLREWENNG